MVPEAVAGETLFPGEAPRALEARPTARNGGKKGDLSRFVDEAVRRRVLDLTVGTVKDRNADLDQQEILDLIDEEVNAARADRS